MTDKDNVKAEILAQVGMGSPVSEVASAYGVAISDVYSWIMEARKAQLKEKSDQPAQPIISLKTQAPQQAPAQAAEHSPANLDSVIIQQAAAGLSNTSTLDMQMNILTQDFLKKLKEVMKRQILSSLHGI